MHSQDTRTPVIQVILGPSVCYFPPWYQKNHFLTSLHTPPVSSSPLLKLLDAFHANNFFFFSTLFVRRLIFDYLSSFDNNASVILFLYSFLLQLWESSPLGFSPPPPQCKNKPFEGIHSFLFSVPRPPTLPSLPHGPLLYL